MIENVDGAVEWLRNTFFYLRAKQNPTFYGFSASLSCEQIDQQLNRLTIRWRCVIIDIDSSNSSIENLHRSGVITFNQEDLSITPLPEAHHMTRHMIHLTTMVTIMKLEPKSSVYNVRQIYSSLMTTDCC